MKVIVACEYSGIVRDAFIAKGHNAISCDLLDTEKPGPHYKGDIFDILDSSFDLMIAHPPCTYMCNSGAKHLYIDGKKDNGLNPIRWQNLEAAAIFFKKLLEYPIEKIAVENPIMLSYAKDIIGKNYTQIIHPWQFGHGETKATCLWLKNLPKLVPSNIVEGRDNRIHRLPPSKNRGKERSKTYEGIAIAMAEQWG